MKKISLNGIWNMEGAGYSCQGTVPGSVYSFLLDAKKIEDPFYRSNELDAVKLADYDFTFSRQFDFTLPQENVPVLLHCDGLDTLCDLYLNGQKVAYTNNMHRSYEFDVTALLKNGTNEIRAVFYSPNRYIKAQHEKMPIPSNKDTLVGFYHLRKSHCMMGWDWGPRLPDAGIWKNIYLIILDSDRLTETRILQRHENGKVFVTPQIKTENGNGSVRVELTSPDGNTFLLRPNCETEIENPMLWWPNGFGDPNLYTFRISVMENGTVSDQKEMKIGLRTVRLIREKDEYGASFCHEINGIRIFAMGADYIPEDCLLSRITPERTETLLKQCVDCNFNTIRVWGGGFYPHDFFFDICDRLGLLVFEDMMFACMNVPGTQEMFDNIACEIRENLIRIRHHASLCVISGNNEMEYEINAGVWGQENINEIRAVHMHVFENLIPGIVREECPDIPYIPSSPTSFGAFIDPANEHYGDSHYWKVWHGNLPFTEYRNHYFRYLSEFGFESFPSEKTVNSFTLESDRNIFSRTMEMHQRCRGGNKKILNYLADTFLYPRDFSTLLYASQLLQAEAIRYGTEHLRRHRGRCMGALYWQLNDVWPVASWASIDYYGRYKALQYVAKRFFAPVMISCREIGETTTRQYVVMEQGYYDYSTEAQLCIANETLREISGQVIWQLRCADGTLLQEGKQNVTVPALKSLWLENLDFQKTDVQNNYISYSFLSDGKVVSRGSALFTVPKHFNFRNPNLRYEIHGDEITVWADCYAKYVEIDSPDSDFILSDNYFDIDKGSVTVKILEGTPKTIRLRSVYDIR